MATEDYNKTTGFHRVMCRNKLGVLEPLLDEKGSEVGYWDVELFGKIEDHGSRAQTLRVSAIRAKFARIVKCCTKLEELYERPAKV